MKSKFIKKKNIILLGGPTASGKSRLALDLAEKIQGEIINADSMQVYKNFPILTSQPTIKDKKNIKHHLYGYYKTNKNYNGSIWLKDSSEIIQKLISTKKVPIVVGGTGLYLEFISQGMSQIPKISINTKNFVNKLIKDDSLENLNKLLNEIDPIYYKKIHINDKVRLIRALEVYFETKKNITYFHEKKNKKNSCNFFKILLLPHKDKIVKDIKKRLEEMLGEGLIEEFRKNNDKVIANHNIKKAIGYQEIDDYLKKNISIEEMSNKIIKNTKDYAKKQLTWFNNRYNSEITVDSANKSSLILECLSKII